MHRAHSSCHLWADEQLSPLHTFFRPHNWNLCWQPVTTRDDEKGIFLFIPFHIHCFKNLSYMILDKSFKKPWLIWHCGHILTDVGFPSTRCIWRLVFTSPALPSFPFKQAGLFSGRGAWPNCGRLCIFTKPIVKDYIQVTISRSFSAVYTILQILRVELCGTKIIQFVRRGCKPALMLPHLALQHCECAMAISNLPSTRILIPSIFKTCSQEDAAHWMLFWCWLFWHWLL